MKKLGFTLIEILIALTVIGVVAALTIPLLSSEVNKKANVIKAKSIVTDLEIAYGNAMADEEVEDVAESKLSNLTVASLEKYMDVSASGTAIKTKNNACISQSGTTITIDVNCTDKPNKANVDKFTYTRQSNGHLK